MRTMDDVNASFWNICFSAPNASHLNDLVPNYDVHDSLVNSHDIHALYTVTITEKVLRGDDCLSVSVVERREEGVLSRVSTEVWEASLLLAAFLLQDSTFEKLQDAAVLELGCGCGFGGLVVLAASLRAQTPLSRLLLTDVDAAALLGIQEALQRQRYLDIQSTGTDPSHARTTLGLQRLDWRDYAESAPQTRLPESRRLSPDAFDLIIGSALVYSPAHVVLADTLRWATA